MPLIASSKSMAAPEMDLCEKSLSRECLLRMEGEGLKPSIP